MPEDDPNKTMEFPTLGVIGATPPQLSARPIRVDFGAMSHAGKVRVNNEDHFLVLRIGRSLGVLLTNLPQGELPAWTEDVGYVMAVADGMGGAAAGERASALALLTGARLVLDSAKWFLKINERESEELIAQLRDYLRELDRTLLAQAQAERSLAGMGTTLTAVYTVGVDAFLVHVGDSRAYLHRGNEFRQLTRDHTVAQSLADAGLIPPDQVHTHSRRHALTNYVGGPPFGFDPEVTTLRLADGDRLLLCSDGLTEMVDDATIADTLLRHPEPRAACRVLVDLALERGGRDNVTVVLALYLIPGASRPA